MAEINDIPFDSHNKFAKEVQQREQELIKYQEGAQVVEPTRIDVVEPSYPSHISSLLGEDMSNVAWSDFPVPPESILRKRSCFSKDLIAPFLGSHEKLESLKKKLEEMNYGS